MNACSTPARMAASAGMTLDPSAACVVKGLREGFVRAISTSVRPSTRAKMAATVLTL